MDNNLTPEQTQTGLDKIAKGDMPDSTNITKVIVDGYQDGGKRQRSTVLTLIYW
ncbi:hypothetical protein [Escherichia coli]|uniref:hypothetical protein n=1 Tax=Escherichia coli TaxID=562 RepID=UPI00201F86BC|nr:hypothetical protein [Escherichia coli]